MSRLTTPEPALFNWNSQGGGNLGIEVSVQLMRVLQRTTAAAFGKEDGLGGSSHLVPRTRS
jgi:hypothetical protein